MKNETTPAMKQYQNIKGDYPDSILFFRIGDFYEMFFDDAITASKALNITLTSRDKNKENPVPMCGVPHHAVDIYIGRLIRKGFKVAVCEQMEDPKTVKGVVKREVIRVITPGTVLNPHLLGEKENNFFISLYPNQRGYGLAVIDISTGDFRIAEFSDSSDASNGDLIKRLKNEFLKLEPKEILVPKSFLNNSDSKLQTLNSELSAAVNSCEDWVYDYEYAHKTLLSQFKTASLDGFGCENMPLAVSAAGAAIYYFKATQKSPLTHLYRISLLKSDEFMNLDFSTQRNLELTRRSYDGSKEGSLLGLLDLTVTSMGGRRLKEWLLKPLLNADKIKTRHDTVGKLKDSHRTREEIRDNLNKILDMERLTARITLSAANARDLIALKNSITPIKTIKGLLEKIPSEIFKGMLSEWDDLSDIEKLIDISIKDEPPLSLKDGGLIKDGYSKELDELRSISRDGKEWIVQMEGRERERTGIANLKVSYNKVFGYFIEITKKHLSKVPEGYVRKQTVATGERYISQELKEYEDKILGAEEKIKNIEYQIFEEIRKRIAEEGKRILKMAGIISEIDVLASLAEVASRYDYICPSINENDTIEIIDGRHPILERIIEGERFVPNDTCLDNHNNQIMIITGPNMAGKSTYMRQVALIVLMAQTGSFVPAREAKVGIVDRIFTRVGAQDYLQKGQSTFMVEMNETANILNNATSRSLIILDEIGRGTSTFDGISIAWSVVEYIHNNTKAKTLFATHYHELTELSITLDSVKNYNIAVKEWNDEIIFLRKIAVGSADKSYGIQVARLAGLPKEVIERAKEVLANLENKEFDEGGQPRLTKKSGTKEPPLKQMHLL
ncbi:MAG: DNA mismatch repair protein MutS [Nitrospinae bacterium RIFCSPLOWO2_12_39_16]|nr:MAG: DNA mismatch repair protein MutS [Nitrospinae bacterium RIFCSPLOWO2_02_39_17]OGW12193.1 MAG: DNA mismatch repair protein MutS [Nitrospinae bacterium RIFCSPLOWO2_12_39_16]HLA48794.1 DNA mismatch repair protein MutS [Nitrospinota bacterium]